MHFQTTRFLTGVFIKIAREKQPWTKSLIFIGCYTITNSHNAFLDWNFTCISQLDKRVQ